MTAHISSCTISGEINAVLRNSLTDLTETQVSIGELRKLTITDGTTSGKANRGFKSAGRLLTSGNSEVIDLFDLAALDIGAGPGQDPLGLDVNNVELVGLEIVNVGGGTYTGNLIVGGEGSTAAWSDFIQSDTVGLRIPPKGFIIIGCPNDPAWMIADSTNHLLKFAASGGDVKYNVHWISRDA
jgi:hypothetical protein